MIKKLLESWPLIQQIRNGADGTGPEAMSRAHPEIFQPKHQDAEFTRSICPYCGVGCGQMVFHKDGKLISIEGDPGSPISRGHLCPKGADTYELHTHPEPADDSEIPPAVFDAVGGARPGNGHGHGRRPGVGEPAANLCRRKRRREGDAHHGRRPSGRRDARQRRKLSDQETFLRQAWAWFASATRPGYDTAPRCPVWAPPSDAAAPPPRSRTWPTPTPS